MNFKENELNLIEEVKNGRNLTWTALALKYDIDPEKTIEKRTKKANDIWRKYKRLNPDLTTTRETYVNGKLHIQEKKLVPLTMDLPKEGMSIEKITTNAYGGQWITYKNQNQDENLDYEKIFSKLLDEIKKSKELPKKAIVINNSGRCAVVNLYDAHLDKIPLKSTCGTESTINKNIDIFNNTIDKIITTLESIEKLNQIILPIGNDLFHTNGFNSQTKKGTQIEYLTSPEDAYYKICEVITQVIIKLSKIAPIKVIMVKGNHDEDKITTLGYWLDKFFELYNVTQSNHFVSVDMERKQRKYITFGKNLIGFAHGDKEKNKIAQMPLIMAQENASNWGYTKFRKFYLGDLHHGFEYQFLKAKDYAGVEVEYLRSVGTTDTWHEDFGYIGIPKTAYVQILDSEEGEIIRYKYNIKDEFGNNIK